MSNAVPVYVQLFGSPQIFLNGSPARLSRRRVRALLYYLSAENKPVSRDKLSDMLWPYKDCELANQNLSIHISYLKKALGDNVLSISSDYVSLGEATGSDMGDFLSLLNDRRPEALFEALRLYKGAFMEGFGIQDSPMFEDWVAETNLFLQNQFVSASGEAAHILERDGKHQQALALMESAAKLDRMNEAVCRQRMRLLERTGKRSAVTQVYSELTTTLNQEYGIPPAPETIRCYQDIITSESINASNVGSSRAPSAPGSGELVFVGREAELGALLSGPLAHFVLIQGKSGLGKTRLVSEYLKRSDLPHISIAFKQQEQSMPYFAFIKLIRSLLHQKLQSFEMDDILALLHQEHRGVLCALVPEMGGAPRDSASEYVVSSRQIFEALEQLFIVCFAGQEAMISIDDIHFADKSSLEAVRYLVSQPTLSHVRFIATFRQSLSSPELIALLNYMQREDILQTLVLEKLGNISMAELLLFYYPDIDKDTAANLITLADGNPLWMKAIIFGLDSGYTEFSGKASLRELFVKSLDSLSPAAHSIIETLAIYGETCEPELFDAICARYSEDDAYLELSTANLIVKDGDGQILFAHPSVYEYILTSLDSNPNGKKLLHYSVAMAMESLYGKDASGSKLITMADHFSQSSEDRLCADYAMRAAAYFMAVDKREDASRYFKLAMNNQHIPKRFETMLSLCENMIQLGQAYEAKIYLQSGINLAKESGYGEYSRIMEICLLLNGIPEYKEVRAGIVPCYRLARSESIEKLLSSARASMEKRALNKYLKDYVLFFSAEYSSLIGDFESARSYLNEVINLNILSIDRSDVMTKIFIYTSVKNLIRIMNVSLDSQLQEVLAFESRIFDKMSFQCLSKTDLGIRAMLANIHGDYELGEQLLNTNMSLARAGNNQLELADCLVTQATQLRKRSPEKSYSMNYEAYMIASRINARYTTVRALTGLALMSSDRKNAEYYYGKLSEYAGQTCGDSLAERLAQVKMKIDKRFGDEAHAV